MNVREAKAQLKTCCWGQTFMSGSKAAPTAIVQQGRARVVVVHWASGEKHHQAVVKYIPLTPSLCPNSSWLPLERKPRWLLDAASASHGKRSPSREVLELSGARKHSTGCWGFILIFYFFFSLPAAHPGLAVGLQPAL